VAFLTMGDFAQGAAAQPVQPRRQVLLVAPAPPGAREGSFAVRPPRQPTFDRRAPILPIVSRGWAPPPGSAMESF